MSNQDSASELRRELDRVLRDLDELPRDAFGDRAPLQARADELRSLVRQLTQNDQVVRDADALDELRTRARSIQAEVDRIATSAVHGGSAAAGSDAGGGGAAEMTMMRRQAYDAQGMTRLQADLGTLLARIDAAERHLADHG